MHSLWHSLGVGLAMADLALSLSGLRLTHRRGRLLNRPNILRRNKKHPQAELREFTPWVYVYSANEKVVSRRKKNVSGLNVGRTNLVEAN